MLVGHAKLMAAKFRPTDEPEEEEEEEDEVSPNGFGAPQ